MTKIKLKQSTRIAADTQLLVPQLPETDLFDLLEIIWRAKNQVVASILGFTLIGIIMAFILPQKWISTATITPAEPTQWNELQQQMTSLQVLGVKIPIDNNELFNSFLKQFHSSQTLEEYIVTRPALMQPFKDSNADFMVHRATDAIAEQIKMVNDSANKKYDMPYSSWTLSFTASKPREAQSFLDGFIRFVADKVIEQTMLNIHEIVALKIQIEKDTLKLERAKLTNEHNTKIKRLNYSLQVAKAAGITQPVYSNGQSIEDDPDFPVALGVNGITRKLEIEKSISDISELNVELRNHQYELSQLESLSAKNIKFAVFNYQQSASLPIKHASPGRLIIIILAALLGLITASSGALLRHYWAARTQ